MDGGLEAGVFGMATPAPVPLLALVPWKDDSSAATFAEKGSSATGRSGSVTRFYTAGQDWQYFLSRHGNARQDASAEDPGSHAQNCL
jgi:hypothetical protein